MIADFIPIIGDLVEWGTCVALAEKAESGWRWGGGEGGHGEREERRGREERRDGREGGEVQDGEKRMSRAAGLKENGKDRAAFDC